LNWVQWSAPASSASGASVETKFLNVVQWSATILQHSSCACPSVRKTQSEFLFSILKFHFYKRTSNCVLKRPVLGSSLNFWSKGVVETVQHFWSIWTIKYGPYGLWNYMKNNIWHPTTRINEMEWASSNYLWRLRAFLSIKIEMIN